MLALRSTETRLRPGFLIVWPLLTNRRQDDATPAFGYNAQSFLDPLVFAAEFPRFRQASNRTTMQEINPINNLIKDLSERTDVLRGYL